MMSRRAFNVAVPMGLAGCTVGGGASAYDAARTGIWRHGPLQGLAGAELQNELVRYATMAPSSHNTQCWRFALQRDAITILPDLARRCPAVDPDDHHLFVSLGCATENLVQAARAHGLQAEVRFEPERDAVHVALTSAAAESSELFRAIPARQSTRGEYDGRALSVDELGRLESVAGSERVRMVLLTQRPVLDRVLDFVVQGNTAQMNDKAFVEELKSWIRFNGADAVARGDGLFSKCSGNPEAPSWLGDLMFSLFFTEKAENDKYTRHLRSSAGVAVFVAAREDKAHWVEVGRAYERFALQATALGVRTAHVNMPVEVAALRPAFARAIGLGDVRPDLVVRFGRGPALPPSLRRPLHTVWG